MNRRAFVLATLATLVLPAAAHGGGAAGCGTASRQFEPSAPAPDDPVALNVTIRRQGGLVAPLPTAEEILEADQAAGHERVGIEYHIVASQTLPAPVELDMESLFLTWTTLEGAVAVRRTWGVAMLQQDDTRWTTSVVDGDAEAQADLLRAVAMIAPTLAGGATLLDLLPSEADLPAGWRLATQHVMPEPCER